MSDIFIKEKPLIIHSEVNTSTASSSMPQWITIVDKNTNVSKKQPIKKMIGGEQPVEFDSTTALEEKLKELFDSTKNGQQGGKASKKKASKKKASKKKASKKKASKKKASKKKASKKHSKQKGGSKKGAWKSSTFSDSVDFLDDSSVVNLDGFDDSSSIPEPKAKKAKKASKKSSKKRVQSEGQKSHQNFLKAIRNHGKGMSLTEAMKEGSKYMTKYESAEPDKIKRRLMILKKHFS